MACKPVPVVKLKLNTKEEKSELPPRKKAQLKVFPNTNPRQKQVTSEQHAEPITDVKPATQLHPHPQQPPTGIIKVYKQNHGISGPQGHFVGDLTILLNLDEESIVTQLKKRYSRNLIYANIGPVLVSLNPNCDSPLLYTDEQMDLYFNALIPAGHIRTSKSKSRRKRRPFHSLPPHLFKTITFAYHHMIQFKKNQSIILCGESGAGKSFSTSLTLKALSRLSMWRLKEKENNRRRRTHQQASTNEKENEKDHELTLENIERLSHAVNVLEAFGHSKTIQNKNSSRFSKWIELGFTSFGELMRARIEPYFIDKFLISRQKIDCSNFHVIYQMYEGFSTNDKNDLYLNKIFQYLQQSSKVMTTTRQTSTFSASISDYNSFSSSERDNSNSQVHGDLNVTLKSLQRLDFSSDNILSIFRVLAAILNLGNISYVEKKPGKPCPRSLTQVEDTAKLLNVNPRSLHTALAFTSVKSGDSLVPRGLKSIMETRDVLAQTLYENLFLWILDLINRKLMFGPKKDSSATNLSFGVLDMCGFEVMETNCFEQFCINYSHEKIQGYIHETFADEQKEYSQERLGIILIEFPNSCLPILDHPGYGILSIIDEHAVCDPETSKSWRYILRNRFEEHSQIHIPSDDLFVIEHYIEPVTYLTGNMIHKNKTDIAPDIIQLMKSSQSWLIPQLFSSYQVSQIQKPKKLSSVRRRSRSRSRSQSSSRSRRSVSEEPRKTRSKNIFPSTASSNPPSTSKTKVTPQRPSRSRVSYRNISITSSSRSNSTWHALVGIDSSNKRIPGAPVGMHLKESLDELTEALSSTKSHFVYCLRANTGQRQKMFDTTLLLSQVRGLCLVQIAQLKTAGHQFRLSCRLFFQRYSICISSNVRRAIKAEATKQTKTPKHREMCQNLLNSFNDVFGSGAFKVGPTRIFFGLPQYEQLENLRYETVMHGALVIQRNVRGFLQRKSSRRKQVYKSLRIAEKTKDCEGLKNTIRALEAMDPSSKKLIPARELLRQLTVEQRDNKTYEILTSAIEGQDIAQIERSLKYCQKINVQENCENLRVLAAHDAAKTLRQNLIQKKLSIAISDLDEAMNERDLNKVRMRYGGVHQLLSKFQLTESIPQLDGVHKLMEQLESESEIFSKLSSVLEKWEEIQQLELQLQLESDIRQQDTPFDSSTETLVDRNAFMADVTNVINDCKSAQLQVHCTDEEILKAYAEICDLKERLTSEITELKTSKELTHQHLEQEAQVQQLEQVGAQAQVQQLQQLDVQVDHKSITTTATGKTNDYKTQEDHESLSSNTNLHPNDTKQQTVECSAGAQPHQEQDPNSDAKTMEYGSKLTTKNDPLISEAHHGLDYIKRENEIYLRLRSSLKAGGLLGIQSTINECHRMNLKETCTNPKILKTLARAETTREALVRRHQAMDEAIQELEICIQKRNLENLKLQIERVGALKPNKFGQLIEYAEALVNELECEKIMHEVLMDCIRTKDVQSLEIALEKCVNMKFQTSCKDSHVLSVYDCAVFSMNVLKKDDNFRGTRTKLLSALCSSLEKRDLEHLQRCVNSFRSFEMTDKEMVPLENALDRLLQNYRATTPIRDQPTTDRSKARDVSQEGHSEPKSDTDHEDRDTQPLELKDFEHLDDPKQHFRHLLSLPSRHRTFLQSEQTSANLEASQISDLSLPNRAHENDSAKKSPPLPPPSTPPTLPNHLQKNQSHQHEHKDSSSHVRGGGGGEGARESEGLSSSPGGLKLHSRTATATNIGLPSKSRSLDDEKHQEHDQERETDLLRLLKGNTATNRPQRVYKATIQPRPRLEDRHHHRTSDRRSLSLGSIFPPPSSVPDEITNNHFRRSNSDSFVSQVSSKIDSESDLDGYDTTLYYSDAAESEPSIIIPELPTNKSATLPVGRSESIVRNFLRSRSPTFLRNRPKQEQKLQISGPLHLTGRDSIFTPPKRPESPQLEQAVIPVNLPSFDDEDIAALRAASPNISPAMSPVTSPKTSPKTTPKTSPKISPKNSPVHSPSGGPRKIFATRARSPSSTKSRPKSQSQSTNKFKIKSPFKTSKPAPQTPKPISPLPEPLLKELTAVTSNMNANLRSESIKRSDHPPPKPEIPARQKGESKHKHKGKPKTKIKDSISLSHHKSDDHQHQQTSKQKHKQKSKLKESQKSSMFNNEDDEDDDGSQQSPQRQLLEELQNKMKDMDFNRDFDQFENRPKAEFSRSPSPELSEVWDRIVRGHARHKSEPNTIHERSSHQRSKSWESSSGRQILRTSGKQKKASRRSTRESPEARSTRKSPHSEPHNSRGRKSPPSSFSSRRSSSKRGSKSPTSPKTRRNKKLTKRSRGKTSSRTSRLPITDDIFSEPPLPHQSHPVHHALDPESIQTESLKDSEFDPSFLCEGCLFKKYKHGKGKSKMFWVSEDYQRLNWSEKSDKLKDRKYILIEDILNIRHGFTGSKRNDSYLSFTIVTNDREIELRADSVDIKEKWMHGIRYLIHMQHHKHVNAHNRVQQKEKIK